jgi:nicotinamide-nucleotide amidase
MQALLEQLARDVAVAAITSGQRVVLAESCTAGLVGHVVTLIPGVSAWFCGSAVVYRNETKTAWLGVDAAMLADPAIGPVSAPTASAMCRGALDATPEATLALSITGHLGPYAPEEQDGLIFISVQQRDHDPAVESYRLAPKLPEDSPFAELRRHRQHEAAAHVLRRLHERLQAAAR